MPRVSNLANDNVLKSAAHHLENLGKSAILANKLRAVIAACKHGITEVAKVYDITRATLTAWIKYVREGQISKLLPPPERKRKPKLSDEQLKQVKAWLDSNPNLTIWQVRERILAELSVDLSSATVHRVMLRCQKSYITPRPMHHKQDEAAKEKFKKKSNRKKRKSG